MHGPTIRRVLIASLVVILAGAATWSGLVVAGGLDVGPFAICGSTETRITPEVEVVGTTAHVQGTTDLPEDSVLWLDFWHPRFRGFPRHELVVRVHDGRFAVAVDLADLPPGPVMVTAEFSIGWHESPTQPPEAIDRYGPEGWCLKGEQVTSDSGDMWLLADTEFLLPTPSASPR